MEITVEIAQPSLALMGAEAWPRDDYRACHIIVAPGTDPDVLPGLMLHEIGHCVGRYEHSDDPASIMGPSVYTGSITEADWAAVKAARDAVLTHRVTMAGLAR